MINQNLSSNILRSKFYVCPIRNHIIRAVGDAVISCCGITLPPLEADETHRINISMLLHLKNPLRLLTRLHHYLAQEGTVIIRDIDDGMQFDQFQFVQIWCFCVW